MPHKKETPFRIFVILSIILCLILLIICCNSYWLKGRVFGWDEYEYYSLTMRYSNTLFHKDYNLDSAKIGIFPENYRPPLIPILTSFIFLITGPGQANALIINYLFCGLLFIILYLIEKELKGKDSIMVLSPFLIINSILLLSFFNAFFADFSSLCILALSIYFLIKSDYLKNPFFSALFGISIGLGQLTRVLFFIYIIFFFIYPIIKHSFIKIWKNYVIAIISALIVCLPWYLAKLRYIIDFYIISSFTNYGPHQRLIGAPPFYDLSYYITSIFSSTSILLLILICLAILLFIFGKNLSGKKREISVLCLWSIISIFIILYFVNTKNDRYILPVLLFISLFISVILEDWIKGITMKKISALIIFIFSIYYIICLFSPVEPPKEVNSMQFAGLGNTSIFIIDLRYPYCNKIIFDSFERKNNFSSIDCSCYHNQWNQSKYNDYILLSEPSMDLDLWLNSSKLIILQKKIYLEQVRKLNNTNKTLIKSSIPGEKNFKLYKIQ